MKTILFAMFALVISFTARAEMPGAEMSHPDQASTEAANQDRGWWQCQVTFESCNFAVGGYCVKWNRRAFTIDRRDARYGCEIARREYGMVRRCRVSCPH